MDLLKSPSLHHAPFLHDGPVVREKAVADNALGDMRNTHRKPVTVADARINDAPQLESQTEWWYMQSHLHDGTSASGEPSHTVVVCVFRQSADPEVDSEVRHNWAVIYATLDWKTQKYTSYSKMPRSMPKYALKALEGNKSILSNTIRDIINSGSESKEGTFVPDASFTSSVEIRQSAEGEGPALWLDWDNGASLVGENGAYHLKVPELELDIKVHATKPLLLHGHNGETLVDDKDCCMFYYSWPRNETEGEYQGKKVVGTTWMDHEYSLGAGGENGDDTDGITYGWRWLSLITTGPKAMEICITQVIGEEGIRDEYVVYLDESGERKMEKEFTLAPTKSWVSGHTFQKFDHCWRLTVPALNVDVGIESVTENQEIQTWLRTPSFYEGAFRFSGIWEGEPIRGYGVMEIANTKSLSENFMEQTLNNATTLVREEAEKWVPSSVRPNHFKHITKVPFDNNEESVIQESIVDAFYMLNNRGGKNWRPMLFGAAVGLVAGDANDWRSFLVIPEMVHTASLIIDDIEDESEARRGGPCVHKVLGVPISINAGCAIYFWGETIIRDNKQLTDKQRKDIYAMYFEMMRVGHAGQALDIAGMTMEKLPTIEEAEAMLSRVINLHRCKSGIPASFGGIVGALVGGGTPEQVDAIGAYVQNLGIAFQIRDDVLDVLGKVKGKNAADDLYNHKITYPVARLFALEHPDREKWFGYWEAHDVPALVDVLKSSGTMERCNDDIQRIAEDGWDLVDSLTPNSFSKVLIRMFAHFLVEEHY